MLKKLGEKTKMQITVPIVSHACPISQGQLLFYAWMAS